MVFGTMVMQSIIGQTLKHKLQPKEYLIKKIITLKLKNPTSAIISDVRQVSF